MHKTISPVEAKQIIDSNKQAIIIDVREEEELAEGYIENSILIPLGSFENQVIYKIPNKNAIALVYCRSGRRSALACNIMDKLGYKNVYDIGGIINWPFEVIM